MNDNDKQFEDFVRQVKFDDTPDANHRDRLEQELLQAMTKQAPRQTEIWRMIMKTRMSKVAVAAVVAIVVLGGVNFWPSGSSQDGKWWLGPPAAWGQEIIEALAQIEALIYRKQIADVWAYGRRHVSGTWYRCYEAKDRYRKDQHYHDTLTEIEWNIPDGEDLLKYIVSFEFECHTRERKEGKAYERDPVAQLRSYVELLSKAGRLLDTETVDTETLDPQTFEGRECVGFEIRYSKRWQKQVDRIWFDKETKLPVRIEMHRSPSVRHPQRATTVIHDQFEYYVELPADMFVPEIPEDFINAHPSEVRAAREKEEKGEMVYAQVPAGLKNEIFAAVRQVDKVCFMWRGANVCVSRYAWREDYYSGDRVSRTEWFVIQKEDWEETPFDVSNFPLRQTTVNFDSKTYEVVTHIGDSRPRHPMDDILFPIGWIDKADRILENTVIEGIECFGLEISAKKYGNNPDTTLHRLWFDAGTKLPVRMEFEWLQDGGPRKVVKDQFEWNAELPADTFTPYVPEGFRAIESNEP
jgi:outer membrane lipoprotein-sorting protein